MKKSLFFSVLLLSVSNANSVTLDNFTPATLGGEITPNYPKDKNADRGGDRSTDSGLVNLTFMVDEQGKPFEIMITRSSNNRFNEEAIKALEAAEYKPATVGSNAVESRLSQEVEFVFSALDRQDSRGATSQASIKRVKGLPDRYSSFYDKFNKEMQRSAPDSEKALALLDKMDAIKHQNFYSLAYLSLARFRYAEKFGSAEDRINALNDLIRFDSRVTEKFQILKDDLKQTVYSGLLKLQIESSHFSEALNSYATFSAQDKGIEKLYADSIAKIESIRENKDALTQRKVTITDDGYTHLPLLKKSFLFDQLVGTIESLKLRCETRFTELNFQSDGQYDIPAAWGMCDLQVIGTPGTTAFILQQ